MSERKLATIRRIAEIKSIEGADRIVSYRVDGWCVTDTIGKYNVGDLVVYCEPDSWVPTEIAPFLTKPGHEVKEFDGIKGERLRTIKLKGVLSQGLLLPVFSDITGTYLMIYDDEAGEYSVTVSEGDDVTEVLGIVKYEKPIPAQLAGLVKGNFPSFIPKTDQERIQNMTRMFETFRGHSWSVTEKLHGSSATFFLDSDDEFHVCSRNLDLKFDENNAYWKVALKFDIEGIMRRNSMKGCAIQGEMIGEGINGNQYQVQLDFYVFDMYNANIGQYILPVQLESACSKLGLKHVPILCYEWITTEEDSIPSLLAAAEGKSVLNGSSREGLVFKSNTLHDLSFKVISNAWLLKNE